MLINSQVVFAFTCLSWNSRVPHYITRVNIKYILHTAWKLIYTFQQNFLNYFWKTTTCNVDVLLMTLQISCTRYFHFLLWRWWRWRSFYTVYKINSKKNGKQMSYLTIYLFTCSFFPSIFPTNYFPLGCQVPRSFFCRFYSIHNLPVLKNKFLVENDIIL